MENDGSHTPQRWSFWQQQCGLFSQWGTILCGLSFTHCVWMFICHVIFSLSLSSFFFCLLLVGFNTKYLKRDRKIYPHPPKKARFYNLRMNKLAASKWSKKNQKQEKMELNYPVSQTVLQNNLFSCTSLWQHSILLPTTLQHNSVLISTATHNSVFLWHQPSTTLQNTSITRQKIINMRWSSKTVATPPLP